MSCLRGAALAALVVTGCAAPDGGSAFVRRPAGTVTFSKDIAPIVHRNCAICHRPGEAGPFSLLTYEDVKKRAALVGFVTSTRYMPPWLPERGLQSFRGERGLTDDQIGLIGQWIEEGAPQGDPSHLPEPPRWTEGWQLGEPDLVVTLDRPYSLLAEGRDVFRNFVIPIPVDTVRYVTAVELRPGNPQVVHHAVMQIDRTDASRRRDEADPGPGFGSMDMGRSTPPDGHFLGWTPGRLPYVEPEEIAWQLDPGTDLVLQLHMVPSGKPEPIRPKVGFFFFSDRPPTHKPLLLLMRNDAIDIPPGVSDYGLEDRFTLPVAAELVGIYPHAHYLGEKMDVAALLPDGRREWLLRIKEWDFNWQDEYRYEQPIALPAGTVIEMDYVYDNSAANVRNPHDPPQRVTYGRESSDEMGTLTLQVLTHGAEDRAALKTAQLEADVRRSALNWAAHYSLANELESQGRLAEAADRYTDALRINPELYEAHSNLGMVLARLGRRADAIESFRRALEVNPDFALAHFNLGLTYQTGGDPDGAIRHYREAIRAEPTLARAHNNLGAVLESRGDVAGALRSYREALRADPQSADARKNVERLTGSGPS